MGKPDGEITAGEAAMVTSLNISNQWQPQIPQEVMVTGLQGMEAFLSLRDLDAGFNSIGDLSPLSTLTELRSLNFGGNNLIRDIRPLSGLTNLESLGRKDRGLAYVAERDILPFVRASGYPLAGEPCPAGANTKRSVARALLAQAERAHRGARRNILAALARAEAAILAALAGFHERSPQEPGLESRRARRLAAPRMPEALWQAIVARMLAGGRLRMRAGFLHLPEHGERMRAADRVAAEKVLPMLVAGQFDPPWVREIAADARLPESQLRPVMARLAQAGEVFQVVKDLYYPASTIEALAAIARTLAARDGAVTAAAFRDATGLGRKRAIQILEFFDRVGLLRRVGDQHLPRPDTQMFAGPQAS